MSAKRSGLAAALLAAAMVLTSCSGGGIGRQLASSLEECSSALASADLSLGQVMDGRSTRAAATVVAEDMRDEISKARDRAAQLKASGPDEQRQRADSLAQMDQALAAALSAHDAVATGDHSSLGQARQRLQQLDRDIALKAKSLKGRP